MRLKPIPGFPGYFISKHGKVWSDKSQKYKKPHLDKRGRPRISLQDQYGLKVMKRISQLVALTWVHNPYPDIYKIVMHKDNNIAHNYYKNLKWGTMEMNVDQMINEGRAAWLTSIRNKD